MTGSSIGARVPGDPAPDVVQRFYRKNAAIEAGRLAAENADELGDWCDASAVLTRRIDDGPEQFAGLLLGAFDGEVAHPGDWIVRDRHGKFRPVDPVSFAEDYEPASAGTPLEDLARELEADAAGIFDGTLGESRSWILACARGTHLETLAAALVAAARMAREKDGESMTAAAPSAQVAAWLKDAPARRKDELRPDSRASIAARLAREKDAATGDDSR